MNCKNPKMCNKKHERWKKQQGYFVPIGEGEHEVFLNYVEQKNYDITIRSHADKRQWERIVSLQDIKDIILNGWVVERNYYSDDQAVRIMLHGYTRKYRPIHVVVEIINENTWEIVTVYDPRSKKYKWTNEYQERICFCRSDNQQ